MKKYFVIALIALISIVAISGLFPSYNYADVDCPVCGGVEVVETGYDITYGQSYHCTDCDCNFFIQ